MNVVPPSGAAQAKFRDPLVTARGEPRAVVALDRLRTLWINTGTLCNITCAHCYIESSPRNDALAYVTCAEIAPLVAEALAMGATEIGFTGGEPFLNRELPAMLAHGLDAGLRALVLTNAMKPMRNHAAALLALRERHGERLTIRVSLDHYAAGIHDAERGAGSFATTLDGLRWLAAHDFRIHVAGRAAFAGDESLAELRAGYAGLFAATKMPIDAGDPVALMLFPEMDASADVPEITTACWDILHKRPQDVMCASSRMVIKRRGAERPTVVACTLLPYDPQFDLGATLAEASMPVALNHPHCAKFCVLGGAACAR